MSAPLNGQRWLNYPDAAAHDPDGHDFDVLTVSKSLAEARRDAEGAGHPCAIFTGHIVNGRMGDETFVEVWPR